MSSKDIDKRGYAQSDILVSTDWVQQHMDDPNVRLIESNEDTLLYSSGHIPGAVHVDWTEDLNDQIRRDYIGRKQFSALMSRIGMTNEVTAVFYGDKNNWWACYALWIFQLFKHTKVKVMDGGRLKWEQEKRKMTRAIPKYISADYEAPARDDLNIRAFRDQVLTHTLKNLPLIDVRSPEEYSGELLHMEGYPNEGALRAGHIPGAVNVPWARAINAGNGTFKTAAELRDIYQFEKKLDPDQEVIAYCRIGERSSHTWFVLRYLLGFRNVRNYDGSWTEWGNLVDVPIEKKM